MNILKKQYLRGLNIDASAQVIQSVSGTINSGCDLYIGTATAANKIKVKNTSGDEIEFNNIIQGTVLPFSVTQIISLTGISNIVALW